jgi:hypothetical protein
VDLPLLSINKSILTAGTLVSLPLWLLVSLLKRNLRKGLIIAYPEVGGLEVELMFNKNVIKLKDNVEYIKEAVDIMVVLRVKQGCDYKDNILVYLKVSLN